MMSLQPTEDAINSVIAITNISRREAIVRLKVGDYDGLSTQAWWKRKLTLMVMQNNNNNPDQAINEFFDDGDSARKRVCDP